jgi:hypothetical protein
MDAQQSAPTAETETYIIARIRPYRPGQSNQVLYRGERADCEAAIAAMDRDEWQRIDPVVLSRHSLINVGALSEFPGVTVEALDSAPHINALQGQLKGR